MPFVQKGKQKSHIERPKKSESAKRARLKVWKRRLVALGMPAAKVEKLVYIQARDLLKRPAKVKAQYAKKK